MKKQTEKKGFNPFGELPGLHFVQIEGGKSVCRLDVAPQLFNPVGVVHGGVMYALADTGMGGALVSDLQKDQFCSTIEIKISYLRTVTGGTLTCNESIMHRGKRIAFMSAEVHCGDLLVAQATGTFAIRTRPASLPST